MLAHLERALIEVYYAIADFREINGGDLQLREIDDLETFAARLIISKSNLERLVQALRPDPIEDDSASMTSDPTHFS